jgi:predicted ABC-type ATPase
VLLPPDLRFLNGDVVAADLVTAGHPPVGVEVAAGRLLLDHLRETVSARQSFCLETTLAARNIVRWIGEWQQAGYWVRLVFVALHTPDVAVRRVAARVADGGHDVPEATIRRRWAGGLRALFDTCIPAVDAWVVIDNSDDQGRLVAAGTRDDAGPEVIDPWRWERLVDAAVGVGSVRGARYGR